MDKEVLKAQLTRRFQQSVDSALKAVDDAPDGQWIAAGEWEVRDIFQKLTADGEIELSRRYFWGKDQGGACPADKPVGIEQGRTSPGAREILCRLGLVQDFGQAADDACRIGNVPVCKEKLRQLVETEAAAITRDRNDGTIKAA